jgi:hypothetical protein
MQRYDHMVLPTVVAAVYDAATAEVVPGLVEVEVAVPRSRPAVW